jgi:hypothetical protein
MTRTNLLLVSLLTLLAGVGEAKASAITYSDFTNWSNAVSGVTTTNLPSNTYTVISSFNSNGVVFSSTSSIGTGGILFLVSPPAFPQAVAPQLSYQDPSIGLANILVTLPAPVNAFAVLYGTQFGGPVTFDLSNGDSISQSSTASIYGLPDFFGVTDTTPFASVQISTTDHVLTIGDVSTGNSSAVPEPSTFVLGALGLLGLGFVARRKQNRVA